MPRLARPDGVEINWSARGDGPLVVLAHSFFSHPELFEDVVDDLAATHRVVTYDVRGTGDSTRRGPYTIATDAGDLAALVEADVGPAVVIALGDGCHRAVHAAAARPDLIVGVISPGGNPAGLDAAAGSDGLAASESVTGALLQMADVDYRAAMRTLIQTANPDMDDEAVRERVNRTVAHCPQEPGSSRLRDWVGNDALDAGRSLGDRLWLLEHGSNLWFPKDMLPRTRELLPEARIQEVPDGPFARPDLTVAAVREMTSLHLADSLARTARGG